MAECCLYTMIDTLVLFICCTNISTTFRTFFVVRILSCVVRRSFTEEREHFSLFFILKKKRI
jgi:hypothetical protein